MQTMGPCLWFDGKAEEAAHYYTTIFDDAKILSTTRYPEGLPAEPGSVLTVEFELAGQRFLALNAGPRYQFTPAVSFVVLCDTQAEIDRLWARLGDGGSEMECGWLQDRYGVTWQVVPRMLPPVFEGPDGPAKQRVVAAMLAMSKLDMAALQQALDGTNP